MAGAVVEAYQNFNESIDNMKDFWAGVKYWVNPLNWFVELNKGLDFVVNHEYTATGVMAFTIIAIWLVMANANWVKKYVFWTWVIYWVLRGFVYRNEVVLG